MTNISGFCQIFLHLPEFPVIFYVKFRVKMTSTDHRVKSLPKERRKAASYLSTYPKQLNQKLQSICQISLSMKLLKCRTKKLSKVLTTH